MARDCNHYSGDIKGRILLTKMKKIGVKNISHSQKVKINSYSCPASNIEKITKLNSHNLF